MTQQQLTYAGDFYTLFSGILTVIGLWKLFRKCGRRGIWALIPGLHFYKLGECAGKETDGVRCLILEIGIMITGLSYRFIGHDVRFGLFLAVLTIAFLLMLLIYEVRILIGLCDTFEMPRWWTVLWVLLPWMSALRWGFNRRYQPVNLGTNPDEEILAGTAPAAIGTLLPSTVVLSQLPEEKVPSFLIPVPEEEGLHVHLRERTVQNFMTTRYLLKDIDLAIPRGMLVLLLGGSGSGKTTLVNAITGYEKADAVMTLNGEDIYTNYDNMKYRIGFVPQQDLLRMNDTVINTLRDSAALRLPLEVGRKERRERLNSVINTLGLSGGQSGLVSKKSGGQKKRISIGMELIADPDLFILDEPDSGLDGVLARELFEKLRMIADQGRIVIAITHTPDRVADLFDRVIVLARDSGRVGRLAFYGTTEEAKEFFGKNSMEQIVMSVNRKTEGGEGRADEFIGRFEALRNADKGAGDAKPKAASGDAENAGAGAENNSESGVTAAGEPEMSAAEGGAGDEQ